MCSTHLEFEWTIDEVSSLNPANVEAHETQFQSIVDPEFEAKAQAAICTYFKEKHTGMVARLSANRLLAFWGSGSGNRRIVLYIDYSS